MLARATCRYGAFPDDYDWTDFAFLLKANAANMAETNHRNTDRDIEVQITRLGQGDFQSVDVVIEYILVRDRRGHRPDTTGPDFLATNVTTVLKMPDLTVHVLVTVADGYVNKT